MTSKGLSHPEITPQIGGFTFYWPSIALSIKTTRLQTHSDGRVTGELFISKNSSPQPIILIPHTQFNFSSEPTRVKYAKQMQAKVESSICWTEIFDFLCLKVQELVRDGAPAIEVWASDDIPSVQWLIKPLIIKGQSNIIFGEKGVSKSTLAYLCGAIIYLAWEDNPLDLEVGDEPIKTLVLDWERDEWAFNFYLARLKRGMNIPAFNLAYCHCNLPLAEDIERIQKYIEATKASLLIIDSLGRAAGGQDSDLKGSSAADRYLTALRSLNTTSLTIAQTKKPQQGEHGPKTIYGSTFFTYYASNIFELCHAEDTDEITKHLALFHRECNFGKKYPPIGFRMEFRENNAISVEREPVSFGEFVGKVSTGLRILDILKPRAMEVKDIAETLDITEANCRVALSRLQKQGKIVKVEKAWGLAIRDGAIP